MSIQSNITQTLSLAGQLALFSPGLRAKAERNREATNLAAQEKQLRATIEATGSDIAAKEPYGEMLTDVKRRQFELNPSEESFKEYKETIPTRVATTEAEPEEIASEIYESEKAKHEVRSMVDAMHAADRAAIDASTAEAERIKKSRDFAKLITEGVSDLSFDPDTYTPPERR